MFVAQSPLCIQIRVDNCFTVCQVSLIEIQAEWNMALFHPVNSAANLFNLLICQLTYPCHLAQSREESASEEFFKFAHHLSSLALLTDVINNLSKSLTV